MELCQDPQLRSLWPPATMATMPIQSEESFYCGTGGSTQGRASASVSLKLKTENGREETRRQEGIRFSIYTQMGRFFCRFVSTYLLEKAGPFFEGNCQMSLRFEKKHLFVDLFFFHCLHTSKPSPLYLWFFILILIFSKCFVVSLIRRIVSKPMTLEKTEIYFLILMCVI